MYCSSRVITEESYNSIDKMIWYLLVNNPNRGKTEIASPVLRMPHEREEIGSI
jgi:hypothetical protein